MLSFYTISIRHCTGLRVSMPVHGFGKVIACGVEFVKPQSCRNVLSLRRTIRRRATGVPRAALQAAVGAAGRGAGRGSSVSWEQPRPVSAGKPPRPARLPPPTFPLARARPMGEAAPPVPPPAAAGPACPPPRARAAAPLRWAPAAAPSRPAR